MKFYRYEITHEAGTSLGFRWFTSKTEAAQCRRDHITTYPEEEKMPVEEIDIEITAAGVLAALRRYAEHPDNG